MNLILIVYFYPIQDRKKITITNLINIRRIEIFYILFFSCPVFKNVVCIFLTVHLNLATFQVLASHVWLVTTVWDRQNPEAFGLFSSQPYCSKFSQGLGRLAVPENPHLSTSSLQPRTQRISEHCWILFPHCKPDQ